MSLTDTVQIFDGAIFRESVDGTRQSIELNQLEVGQKIRLRGDFFEGRMVSMKSVEVID